YQLQTYGTDYDFGWLEDGLAALDFRLVFLTRSPESFAAARAERLKVSGNPSQYDDLSTFVEQQKLMRRLVGESKLRSLTLDVSDNDIPAAVTKIADWMEQTGGLYNAEH
ncbi:MAG TPA: hypothetical protein PL074_03900, partial [Thermoflexales bacterium]|nr:hypothetical protein [Thermoflexales bacterium]